jgi:hypothetical protein
LFDVVHRQPHIASQPRATTKLRHGVTRIFEAGIAFDFFAAWAALPPHNNLVEATHAIRAQHVQLAGKGEWSFEKRHNRLILG